MVGEKYITAVRDGAGAMPLLIPVLDPAIAAEELIAACDGFLFTGSPSNVAPKHYGGTAPRDGVMQTSAAMTPPCRCSRPRSRRASRCCASAAASRN
jgi:putative glutamine amidotransferase